MTQIEFLLVEIDSNSNRNSLNSSDISKRNSSILDFQMRIYFQKTQYQTYRVNVYQFQVNNRCRTYLVNLFKRD